MQNTFIKKIIGYISVTVLTLTTIVSIWFLLNNLRPLSPGLYSFTIVLIIGLVIFLKLFATNFLQRIGGFVVKTTRHKHLALVALPAIALLGILVRLFFYFRFSYTPISDPITFYNAAQKIADGHGIVGYAYPAFFPYLAAYDNILGLAMKVVHSPWLATILLNTVLDLGAAIAAYLLIKRMAKPKSKLPIIVFGAWLLNPFNILFSVLSLPIVTVNFFIIVTLLLVCLLLEKIATMRISSSLVLALLLGITIGVGNCFRPIFIIAIVALFLSFLFLLAKKKQKSLPLLLGSVLILVVAIFFSIQKLNLSLIASETGLKPASNASGWSIFVGSNWENNGAWNRADEVRMSQICKNTKSFDECHDRLRQAGVERYKSYGANGILSLFIRKLYIFSSNQSYVYNADQSIPSYTDSRIGKIMSIYTTLFMFALFYLSARFFYYSSKAILSKNEILPMVLFTALLMLGFFLSDMLVETSARYAQIMYPLFIVTAVLSLGAYKSSRNPK